jgi:hypothetical protein
VAKNPIPDRVENQDRSIHPHHESGQWGGDRDGDQRDRDVGPMLDGLRGHDVEQHIAQHAAADSREHSQRRDSEQVEAFPNPDGRT